MKSYASFNIKVKVFLGKFEEIMLFYKKNYFFKNYFLSYYLDNYIKIHLYKYDF